MKLLKAVLSLTALVAVLALSAAGRTTPLEASVLQPIEGFCDDRAFVAEHRFLDGAGWTGGNFHEAWWGYACEDSAHVEGVS